MDPVSVIGIASAIVQFITFTSGIISKTAEIKQSASGRTVNESDLDVVASNLVGLTVSLDKKLRDIGQDRDLSQNEIAVQRLGERCQSVSEELQKAINGIKKASSPSSGRFNSRMWSSFRQALKSFWKQDRIESLERQLERLSQQLIVSLLLVINDYSTPRPSLNASSSYRDDKLVQRLDKHIADSKQWQNDLLKAVYQNQWRADNSQHVALAASLLLNGVKADRTDFLAARLRYKLSFIGIEDRQERVTNACKRTFEWIFQDDSSGQTRGQSFRNWLQQDADPYWVTGKPGSGKSTLLKFLYHDPRTRQVLNHWAQGHQLIMSAFFFWNSGSSMQMSKEGLLRSLLFRAISQCPRFTKVVFPSRWEVYNLFGDDPSPWTISELLRAFELLVAHHGTSVKFFFLIDGLDEFEGEKEDLIEWLQNVLAISNVKIYVSSRPWPVFEDAFRCSPSLQMEDLTSNDMEKYIETEFSKNPRIVLLNKREPNYVIQLIQEIATKAAGVFLWVRLSVKSLLTGLSNGDRVSDLRRRLSALPAELEDLFRKMLDSIEPFYLEHASQLFQLVASALSRPTILTLSFADEDDSDAVFKISVQPLTRYEILNRVETVSRRINSRCKGLLEAVPHSRLDGIPDDALEVIEDLEALDIEEDDTDSARPRYTTDGKKYHIYQLANFKVEYLHRTVKDYLAKPQIWNGIIAATAGTAFDPDLALCKAHVLVLKTVRYQYLQQEEFWSAIWMALEHAARIEKTGHAPADVLDELNRVAIALKGNPNTADRAFRRRLTLGRGGGDWTKPGLVGRTILPKTGFIVLSIQCGLLSYVARKLDEMNGGSELDVLLFIAMFNSKLLPSWMENTVVSRSAPDDRMIKMLLDRGADPDWVWMGRSGTQIGNRYGAREP